MRKRTHSIIGFSITGLILCQAAAGWGATLSGRVYEGNVGDETKPLSRVTVTLYGSNNSGQQGMYITSTTTNSDGWYGLEVESGFEFYHIVETNPEKYTSVGAMTVSGTVINNDWIQYVVPIEGKTLTGNKFWDKKEGQPPENHPPVANAGPDQTANVGNVVHLNGSGSSDMDGDPLTYRWSLISVPGGSSAALSNATAVQPTFVVDLPGTYVAQLVVNDGKIDSSPDTVVVIVEGQPPSETGTIRGVKFNDENGDGIWNGPETGMAGWTIFADMDPYNAQLDPGEPSDVTNQSGSYCFVGLAPGVYTVYEVAQSGWQITYPSSGFYGITIQGNDLWDGKDFGNQYRETPPSGEEACCLPDGSCASLTPEQCRLHGGTPQGPGTACMGDNNGDGIDDLCGGQPPAGEFDFGDAPRPYPTLHADQGAYHDVNPALCLGLSIDAEPDGQPDASATGDDNHDADDEDGVRFTSSLQAGSQATVQVAVLAPQGTYVNVTGWIDFNADNQWQDPQERIFSENTWAPVTLTKTFTVPSNAQTGTATFARFRLCRAHPGADFLPSPLGYGGEGEVEDYQVLIGREGPPSVGESYVFAVCFNVEIALPDGSIHKLSLSGPATGYFHIGSNGQASDTNANGRDDAPAELMSLQLAGVDPVLGNVRMVLNPAVPSTGQIEERINNTPGVFDVPPFTASGWADSFFDVWFQIDLPSYGLTVLGSQSKRLAGVIDHLPPASNPYSEAVPTTIELVDQNGQLTGIRLGPLTSCQGGYRSDYGDAPAPYPDASHVPGMVWLGFAAPDTDAGTQASPPGEGDDTHGIDDEDGAALMSDLVPGQFAWVGLALSGSNQDLTYAVWIDYNRNGTWEHPTELYASGNVVKLATSPLGVVIANPIPAGAQIGTTYMRCRVYPGLNVPVSPTGNAQGGEVEDYQVQIKRTTGQIQPPGHTITGIKFNDLDGDGSWEPLDGEGRLPNWTIWLDTNNDGTPDKTTQTDSQGSFEFTLVQPGTYTIGEQQQAGWTQTAPGGAGTFTVTVPGGLQPTISFAMFGNRRTGESGSVTVVKKAVPADDTPFDFAAHTPGGFFDVLVNKLSDPSANIWSLSDLDHLQKVAETVPAGWTLADIAVTGDTDHGSSTDLANATVYVDYDEGEDIVIIFTNTKTGPDGEYDYGDAPDTYGTLHSSGGPYHDVGEVLMGGLIDPEPDGQPGPQADRDDNVTVDDEDGVTLMIPMAVGGIASIRVDITAPIGVPAAVTGWVDFDHSGTFEDPAERIASGIYTGAGTPVPWTETFQVPATAKGGETYMRFRIYRTEPGVDVLPSPIGYGGEGEVEDYKVYILSGGPGPDDELDFGDAPSAYPAASHNLGGPRLGDQAPDAETGTQPNPPGLGDDNAGTDDEDGAQFLTDLVLGQIFAVSWKAHTSDLALLAAGWIDFNRDGDWDDPGEFLGGIGCQGFQWAMMTISKPVPAGAKLGKTYARFRVFSGMGGGTLVAPSGHGGPGEVEDYEVEIKPAGVVLPPGEIIGGVKFNDQNGNGVFDTGEQGLANWTIWIDLNGNGVKDAGEDTLTNPDGTFYFMALSPGTYIVHEDMQPGWYQICPGGAGTQTIAVQAGKPTPSILFGNRLMGDEEMDFGDAPDTYKTLQASGGAYHKAGPLTLGRLVDVEPEGVPGPDATGDDLADKDDEDGLVSSLNLTTGKIGTLSLVVANAHAAGDSGIVAGWIDFDGNGQFDLTSDDIGTQYVSVPGGGQSTIQFMFLVPVGAKAGKTYARFRLYSDDPNPLAIPWAILPTGGAGYGEVEDYVVNIRSGVSANDRDYGDAPLPYPSADHQLGGPYLGLFGDLPDRDTGMQRDAAALGDDTDADGDDENGLLSINLVKTPGVWSHAEIRMWTGSAGALTGAIWIDWNADGDWDDPGELVGSAGLSTTPVPPGGAWLHVTWGFPVPSVAKPGNTFARLRVYEGFNVALSPNGPGAAGEVEDHLVQIKASGPGLPPGGIVHGYKWNDQDGDGVWDAAEPGLGGWTIWLDLNGNGSQDAGDRYETTDGNGYFRFTGVPAGTYTVGERPQSGWTQTCPGAPGTYTETVTPGAASVALMFGNSTRPVPPPDTLKQLDWGDAPDPTYPTLRSSNGAYHVIVPGFQLGGTIDPELDGQPSPDATADDHFGADDEDGVLFLTPLIPGQQATVEVVTPSAGKLDAWIDFGGDGGWTQATDQIAKSVPVSGSTVLGFQVPASTTLETWVYARFRLSTQGGLSYNGPGGDGEVEDYRVWIGEPGPAGPAGGPGLVKWSQPPIEIDPNPDRNVPQVFCGWNEPARSTHRSGSRRQWRMDADDFRCLGLLPVTRIRWWGGHKGWNSPEPPELQPEAWHIGFWANQVPGLAPDNLYLERLVWSIEVPNERVHREPVGLTGFPQQPPEMCFVYNVRLEPDEWFHQAEFPTNEGVFWISITAIYPPDAEQVNQWCWTTRPHVWRDGAVMPAIMGEWPMYDERLFPGRIVPIENSVLCGQNQAYDLCFALLTDPPWIKWDQPFTGIRDWPYYMDRESQGTSIRGQESLGRLVADDWMCEPHTPVIAAAWWGSYIGYGYEACQCEPSLDLPRPDYFLLTISTNVGPARETDYGRPGDVVWQYRAYDYDEVLVGYDKEPQGEPNEPVFRYSVRLPEDNWFRQEAPGTIYWFSVAAVYTDPLPMIVYPWGWTNHPAVFESAAVFIDYRARPRPEWRPLHDPLDRLVDMSFTLFTRPE